MEKSQLTPLKIEYFVNDPFFGTHYKINDLYCCKPVGDSILESFPKALTEGVNPIDLWVTLSNKDGDYHYEEATILLQELPEEEQSFIRDFLAEHEEGKYEVDENYDDYPDCDDDDLEDDWDEDDDWDGDPDMGPKVE